MALETDCYRLQRAITKVQSAIERKPGLQSTSDLSAAIDDIRAVIQCSNPKHACRDSETHFGRPVVPDSGGMIPTRANHG